VLVLAAALALCLAGCIKPTVWTKPGATASEWEQVKAACLLEAAREVPVAPVYTLRPGHTSSSTHCDRKGQNCSVYETVTPPSWQQDDANAGLREQVARGCFARHGWVEQSQP